MSNNSGGFKAIFLDRDGVLNASELRDGKPYAPRCYEDFKIYPEVGEALWRFKRNGYLLIVVTNQPDVGNGLVEKDIIEEMNASLVKALPIDGVKVCYHAQSDGCACRKPKPGMILQAALEFGVDLSKSYMIGDRKGDVDAGRAAGCFTVFLDHGYRASERPSVPNIPDYTVLTLNEAVNEILAAAG